MSKKIILFIVLVIAGGLLVAACTGPAESEGPANPAEPQGLTNS